LGVHFHADDDFPIAGAAFYELMFRGNTVLREQQLGLHSSVLPGNQRRFGSFRETGRLFPNRTAGSYQA
jgi:hypothetical protein